MKSKSFCELIGCIWNQGSYLGDDWQCRSKKKNTLTPKQLADKMIEDPNYVHWTEMKLPCLFLSPDDQIRKELETGPIRRSELQVVSALVKSKK